MTWQKVKISSFLKERESRIKPEEANKMGLKRLNKIDFSGITHLSDKLTNTDMILIKPGDLVISGINVEKGAVAVYQGDKDILATIHYSAYIFDKNKIEIEYFKNFLKSRAFQDIINSQIRSGIKTELKAKHFLPLEINLPDLATQRIIRYEINLESTKILDLEKTNNQTESYISSLRSSILSEAVQGKLVSQDPKDEPASELLKKIKAEKEKLIKEGKIKKQKALAPITDEEVPYDLPNGWEWCRLGDICEFIYGEGLTKENRISEGKFPVYGSNGIVGYFDKYLTDKRAIIIGRKGSSGALNISELPNWTTDVAYYIEEKRNINFKFLFYLLKSLNLEEMGKGIKPGLNRNEAYDRTLGLPPLSEQQRIVSKVDKLMAYCDELEKQVKENQQNTEKLMEAVLKESFQD